MWQRCGIYFLSATAVVPLTKSRKREQTVGQQNIHNYQHEAYKTPIANAKNLVARFRERTGAPGVVVGVSVNGKLVWKEGFGFADVETLTPCHGDVVMRIASISKPIAMMLVAKLWEQGRLDLDAPVQRYVPSFPEKVFQGEKVTITTRMLISHLSGIRHYKTDEEAAKVAPNDFNGKLCKECHIKKAEVVDEENFSNKPFKSVAEALKLFSNDPLVCQPGEYHYSTHAWILASAVVEAVTKEEFPKSLRNLLKQLGLKHTYLDENSPIIPHRARYYFRRNANHMLENVPTVDTSFKWAGGGLLSTVGDLLQFANLLLYSYQCGGYQTILPKYEGNTAIRTISEKMTDVKLVAPPCCTKKGCLEADTLRKMWVIQPSKQPTQQNKKAIAGGYGLGWYVIPADPDAWCMPEAHGSVEHAGGAVGASSMLLICPLAESETQAEGDGCPPRGICVALLMNLEKINARNLAIDIAETFRESMAIEHDS